MTPREAREELKKLTAACGHSQAGAIITFNYFELPPLSLNIYPRGTHKYPIEDYNITFRGEDFAGLFELAYPALTRWLDNYKAKLSVNIAKAIMAEYAENGECKYSALRLQFNEDELRDALPLAITHANAAASEPFVVTEEMKGNDEP